jgi:spore coat protein JB
LFIEKNNNQLYRGELFTQGNKNTNTSPAYTEKKNAPMYSGTNTTPMNGAAGTAPMFTERKTSPAGTGTISSASGGKSVSPASTEKNMISPYAGQNFSAVSSETNSTCPDASGIMPACAPLAVPYVPFQQKGSKKYNPPDALSNGTLFPGLNLPFHLKAVAPDVVNGPLTELQALDFVVHELGLYLDTHPEDTEAFELYKQYAAMAKEARMKYVDTIGQLTHHNPPNTKSYVWTNDPWPWNSLQKGWGK